MVYVLNQEILMKKHGANRLKHVRITKTKIEIETETFLKLYQKWRQVKIK